MSCEYISSVAEEPDDAGAVARPADLEKVAFNFMMGPGGSMTNCETA